MPTFLYRVLLRAYPRPFRDRYGADLVEAHEALRTHAARAGWRGRIGFAGRTVVDTLVSGVRERMSARGYRLGGGGVRLPSRGVRALFGDLALDLRWALRSLRRTPGYLVGVTLTLALGIGANTALFSAAWGVFGRALPFAEGNELVHVRSYRPDFEASMSGSRDLSMSVAEIEDLRTVPAFEDVAEYHRMSFTLVGPRGPELVRSAVVSSNYFDFLGMAPMLGRLFDPVEDHIDAEPVIVLSHAFWVEAFEADPGVIGTAVRMNGREHEVVGVLPPIPQFPQVNEIYLPISMCPTRSNPDFIADRDARMMTVYARLRDGASLAAAESDLDALGEELHAGHESYARLPGGHGLDLSPLREELVAGARPVMWPLVAVSALLLLIACANAAGLALTRALRRMDALAVRSAMGAGKGRLARQLLTESVLLAVLGGLVGLGVAALGSDLLATFAERFTSRAQEIRLDRTVLGFALVASVATGLIFGVAPVSLSSRLVAGTGRAGRATLGRRGRRTQRLLVALQVTVAVSVLSASGLLLRSFWVANSERMGFETENVIVASFSGGRDRYPGATDFTDFMGRVRTAFAADPAVLAVARTPFAPIAEPHEHRDGIWIGGGERWTPAVADVRGVDPEFLDVLEYTVLEGRGLQPADTLGGEPVAVVNRTFRDRYMEGIVDVGAWAKECEPEVECGPPVRIVGVVEDLRINGPEFDPTPRMFVPLDQSGWFAAILVARVTGSPDAALRRMVGMAQSMDDELAVRDFGTLERFRRERVAPRRFVAGLVLAFGVVAGGLAVAGVFGVTALAASARTRELGIRRALGATAGDTRALVLREGLTVVGAGGLAGLGLSFAIGRVLEGLLYGVPPWDPPALIASVVFFGLVAAAACLVPARRAARMDVAETLSSP